MPKGIGYGKSKSQMIPTLDAPKRKKKKKLGEITFEKKASPKKLPPLERPSRESSEPKRSAAEELKTGLAKGLATASSSITGRGTAGRIAKAGLAGASAGSSIDAAIQRHRDRKAKEKGKAATTTVTQSAMAQKAMFHKKDKTKTKKV